MKPIKFTQNISPYKAGDIAGFPDEIADAHIASGVAVAFIKSIDEPPKDKAMRPAKKKSIRKTKSLNKENAQ